VKSLKLEIVYKRFYLGVVVVCSSSTDVFLWGSSLPCTDVVCVLTCRYVTAFFSPLLFLVFGGSRVSYM
jgi:hypothetical protein